MLFADRIVVFYKDNESCIVEYNLVVTDIRKMTFKKDDKTVLSLYFMDKTNTLFLLRVKTDASKELLEDIQIMIEDYSN